MSPYTKRFLVAVGASVSIHLLVVEVWFVMAMLDVITGRTPKPVPPPPKPAVPVLTLIEPPRPRPKTMTFVETDASQESKQAPKDAKLFSDRSTLAASPTAHATESGEKPKLQGQQDKVLSTANVVPQPLPSVSPPNQEKPAPQPPKPAPPQPEPKAAPKPEEHTVGKKTELVMQTREPQPKPELPKPPAPKPETREARLIPPRSERIIATRESKTESDVSRRGQKSFAVIGTGYGAYDKKMFATIQSRWENLLEKYTLPAELEGKVCITFRLNEDGTVSELTIVESTSRDILAAYCQMAVNDSAPFDPWPESMRAAMKQRSCSVNVIFYY